MSKIAVAVVLLAASLSTAAMSTAAMAQQQRGGTEAEQKACARDVTKFCRSVMNEPDLTVLACLQQNRPKISKACNAVLVSHGQ